MTADDRLRLAPDVRGALDTGRPVVALESTIIAHGMPYPRNVETARAVEAAIRDAGAVPATIAVMGGRIRVGLDEDALDTLGRAEDVAKLSRRDLAGALATGRTGATTVAATMAAAHLAGIEIFVTGGIGGVHRGADTSFDVSADLDELARTPVAVVCAGAKSILDLPKTLEYLETRGVPVLGFRTGRFPAFYSRESGLELEHRCDSVAEVAAVWRAHRDLGGGGAVIANPIPEDAALPAADIDAVIGEALDEAARQGIAGKDVTPHLLSRIVALTGGRSLDANIALVLNNAWVGADIAVALAKRA